MQIRKTTAYLFIMAALLATPLSGIAQDEESDDVNENILEEIVVTGTATARTEFETPQSVTQYSEEDIRLFSASSQADILTQLPGVSAEGGGGEVATNVFHRALPSGGQFSFTPLLYDGIPSFSTFGLNSSAFDVYIRNDLGIERAEFVSGGVSNLFGPGSVAGIINYISKTGGSETEGTVQLEVAEEGRVRTDYYFSGALGGEDSDTFYALSGYYRSDDGPLDSGIETEGFQLRGNLKHLFSDGSGSLTIFGQAIDDSVQFFLPLPLDGQSRERLNGNDGREVFTMNTVAATGLSYQTPDGRFTTPIKDGVVTKGFSIAAVLDKDLNEDWSLNSKIKYASYDHQFNLFLDGDGIGPNTPESLNDYMTNRGIDAFASNAQFSFVGSGQALPSDFLLFGNRTLDRDRDATDASVEVSVSRLFSAGNMEHVFTFGGFWADSEADDVNYITTYLGDFRNAPLLVDLSLIGVEEDAEGNLGASADPNAEFRYTLNGLARANGMTGNSTRSAERAAFYIADQIEMDRWTFDIGGRLERLVGEVTRFNTSVFTMDDDPLVSNGLEQVSFTNGSIDHDTAGTTEWALSGGTLFRLTDTINLFGNVSRGYFFPQIRSVKFDSDGKLASYEGEIITSVETGVKYRGNKFDGYVTFFWTELDDRQNVDFVNDPNNPGGVIEEVTKQSTEAYGIEANGVYYINDYWSINANVTLRDHEFTKAEGNPAIVGNELRRQPKVMANTGIRFHRGAFDAALLHNYHGDNFANDSNSVELDSYNLVRLEAGYTFQLDGKQSIRVSASVFNLTDEEGITEGSPRQGNSQSGEVEQFFVGRPILPQRATVKLTYDF